MGEEVTTRNGHLVGLFMTKRIRPWGSIARRIARIHEQGGLAIVAHPLVPYPLCASERTIRRLLDEPDPLYHPDAIEAFNPTTARHALERARARVRGRQRRRGARRAATPIAPSTWAMR